MKELFNKNYQDNEILGFVIRQNTGVAREHKQILQTIISKYLGNSPYSTISEYKEHADYRISYAHYQLSDISTNDFIIINQIIKYAEIILKDRTLRTLAFEKAYLLIIKCAKYFIDFFREKSFKILITQCVDSYIVDIMIRVASYFDVKVIGFVRWLFPGYIRITSFGEFNEVREPSEEEINTTYDFFISKQRTIGLKPKDSDYLYSAVYLFFIYKYRCIYKYLWQHKILGKKEYDFMVLNSAYPKKLSYLFSKKYFLTTIPKIDSSKTIYIPLQFTPEASSDVWMDEKETLIDFRLVEVIKYYVAKGFHILIKEHPYMNYRRPPAFYKIIKNLENTYLLSPYISTHEVFKHIDKVVVWTSTVGIEALLYDKEVITVGDNFYSFGKLNKYPALESPIAYKTIADKKKFIQSLLSNTLICRE